MGLFIIFTHIYNCSMSLNICIVLYLSLKCILEVMDIISEARLDFGALDTLLYNSMKISDHGCISSGMLDMKMIERDSKSME